MEKPLKKQFISGASCPKCHALDKVQLWDFGEGEDKPKEMHCTACGYVESLSDGSGGTEPRVKPVKWK